MPDNEREMKAVWIQEEGLETYIVRHFLQHAHLLRELHIELPDVTFAAETLLSLNFRAPNLERLSIHIKDVSIMDDQAYPNYGYPRDLPSLFKGNLPNLRQLSLHEHISFAEHSFPYLTHLFLSNKQEMTRPSYDDLVDFLSRSPLLEELVIVTAGYTVGILPPPLELTHLSRLVIDAPDAAQLLACLKIPMTTAVRLLSTTTIFYPEPLSELPLPAVLPPDVDSSAVTRLGVIQGSHGQGMQICGSTHGNAAAFRLFRSAHPEMEAAIGLPLVWLLDSPHQQMSFHNLRELFLHFVGHSAAPPDVSVDHWMVMLSGMPSLTTLCTKQWPMGGILAGLLGGAHEAHDAPECEPTCPSLKEIRIYQTAEPALNSLVLLAQSHDAFGLRLSLVELHPELWDSAPEFARRAWDSLSPFIDNVVVDRMSATFSSMLPSSDLIRQDLRYYWEAI